MHCWERGREIVFINTGVVSGFNLESHETENSMLGAKEGMWREVMGKNRVKKRTESLPTIHKLKTFAVSCLLL